MSTSDQGTILAQINQRQTELAQLLQSLQGQGAQGQSTASAQGQSAQGQGTTDGHADYSPRERLQVMLLRAYIDDDYAASLKVDPAAALRRAGFSDADSRELTQEQRGPEAALARGSCKDTTCMISICPSSCVASIPAIPGICTNSPSSNPITQTGKTILESIFGGF